MLDLFLLTEAQLDALAVYYSQTHSTDLTNQYPQTMNWQQPFLDASDTLPENCKLGELERLKIKMRMFARFIGMRGADTPRWEYDRQIEILRNKIQRRIMDEEEKVLRKFYQGPCYNYCMDTLKYKARRGGEGDWNYMRCLKACKEDPNCKFDDERTTSHMGV
ncbi:uncharacterized protein J4E78_004749 [Alternaria triticimaculans]|uniref:uncharacterized protein n=1 Tax=Alternaria triticimaculans TaxID=297637 RepID=UPI0020C1D81C|nr:uncharacterized protein J4E78_004749 [Alternaria triticimaculans]KAI4661959.1 hypothetical protein J4E78_004749 [Alternaria triticimaculans]